MMNSGSTTATSPSHSTPLITDHRDSDNNPSSSDDGSSSSSPTDANKVPSYVNLARCVSGYSSFTSYTSPARREYSPARRDFSPIGRLASTSSNQRHRDTSLSRRDKPLSPCREHWSQDNVILLSPSKENFVKNSFDTTRGRHTLDNRENLSPGSGSQPVGGQAGGDQQGLARRVGRTSTGGGGGLFNVMAEQSPTKPNRLGHLGDTGSTTTTTSSGFFTSPSRSSRYTSNSISSSRTSPPSGLHPLSPPSSNGVGGSGLNSTALVVDVNRLRNGFQTRSGETRLNGAGFGSNGSPATGVPPLADVVDSDIRRRVELLEKASHRNLDVNINKTPTPAPGESRYARSGTVTGPSIENVSGLHHPGASRGIAHQSLNYHPFGGNYHREGKAHHLLSGGGGGSSPGKNGNSYPSGKEIITLDDSPPGANGREDKVSPIPVMKLLNPEFRAMLGKTTKISPNKQFSAGGGGDLSSPHAVARIESTLRENGRKSMPTSGLAPVGTNGVVSKPVSTNSLASSTDIRNNNETHGTPLRSLNLNNSFSKTSPVSMGENHERMANNKAVNLNVIVNNTRNLNNTTTTTDVVSSSRKIINTDRHSDDDRKLDTTTSNTDRNEAENEQENLLNTRNNNFRMSPSRENAFGRDQNNMIIVNNLDSMDRNNEFFNNKNQRMSNGGGGSFNNKIFNEENNDECFNNEGQVSRIRNDLFKKIDSSENVSNKSCENSNRSSCEKSPRTSCEKIVDSSLNSKTSTTSVVVDSKNNSSVNVEELKQENAVSHSKLVVTKDVLVKQINSSSTNISSSGSYSKESHQQTSQKHSITLNSFDSNEDKSFNDIENNARKSPSGNDTTMNEDISRIENSTIEIASKDQHNHVSSIDNFNSNDIRNGPSKDNISPENTIHPNTAKDSQQTHSKEEKQQFNDKKEIEDVKEFKTENKLTNNVQNKKEINSKEEFKTDKNVSDTLPTFNDVKTDENAIDDAVNGNIVQQETPRQILSPVKNITKSFIEAEREFVSSTNVNKSEDIDNQKVKDIKEDGGNLLKDNKNKDLLVDLKENEPKLVHNIPNIKTDMKIDSIKNEIENFTTQIASSTITKDNDDSKTCENVLDFTTNTNSGAFKDEPSVLNSNLSHDSTDFIVNKDISSGIENVSKLSENDANSVTKLSNFTIKDNATKFNEDSSSNITTTVKDGDYYKQLLSTDRKILTEYLNTFETVMNEHQAVTSKETSDTSYDLSEDTVDKANNSPISSELEGQILLTIGQCKLLLNKKFPFFERNCEKSLRQAAGDVTVTSAGTEELLILNEDLTGLWDTICIQIEEVRGKFEMLTKLRQNNWVPESGPKIDNLKSSCAAGKRSSLGNSNSGGGAGCKPLGRSIKSTSSLPKPRSAVVSAKNEERKKFLEEKRKAMIEQKRKEAKKSEEVEIVLVGGGEKERENGGGDVQLT